ncbi:hypothetical protein [Oribacterium sinus]
MEKNQVIYYHSASHQDNAEERMENMQSGQNISDNGTSQLSWKSLLPIALTTVFVFVFAKIYGIFSHGVYSAFMSYAFLLPLTLIFLPKLLNLCTGNRLWNGTLETEEGEKKLFLSSLASFLWKSGVAVLTVGSIYKGVLDIYGTSGTFEWIYLVVGILALVSGGIAALLAKKE